MSAAPQMDMPLQFEELNPKSSRAKQFLANETNPYQLEDVW